MGHRDIVIAIAAGLGAIGSWVGGLLVGYILGKKYRMTRREAARVMALASWRNR